MSWLSKIVGIFTGRNGFDKEQHDEEVRKIKDETLVKWDRVADHLEETRGRFAKVEEDLKAEHNCEA